MLFGLLLNSVESPEEVTLKKLDESGLRIKVRDNDNLEYIKRRILLVSKEEVKRRIEGKDSIEAFKEDIEKRKQKFNNLVKIVEIISDQTENYFKQNTDISNYSLSILNRIRKKNLNNDLHVNYIDNFQKFVKKTSDYAKIISEAKIKLSKYYILQTDLEEALEMLEKRYIFYVKNNTKKIDEYNNLPTYNSQSTKKFIIDKNSMKQYISNNINSEDYNVDNFGLFNKIIMKQCFRNLLVEFKRTNQARINSGEEKQVEEEFGSLFENNVKQLWEEYQRMKE